MKRLNRAMKHFIAKDSGATAFEYAVVVALIIIVAMVAILAFGNAVSAWFSGAAPTVGGLRTS